MRELDLQTLLNLLQMYQAAIAELRATRDQRVMGLINRLEQRQAEAITAIAEKNAEAIAAVRASALS
ncbi:MAG: hypothetical protein H0W90_13655 [Actinobacteria bacterium]|nr:hypothetical protein [Actinomycetota bacterium]